ncbi:MAG: 50S ribosomal protein L25 [Candidatus Gracilibacteria bacterium]
METFKLKAEIRDTSISTKNLRKTDVIPAVLYGRKVENVSLQVNYQEFRKIYRKAGSNGIIDLDVGGKTMQALVHNIDLDSISGKFIHIDFLNVNMNEEITARIPLEFTGVAPAVKDLGGILVRSRNELQVKCLPAKLVSMIKVDLSPLINFHVTITVGDLKLPEGIKVLDNVKLPVATVTPTKEEVEEVKEVTTVAAGPEILKQGPEEAVKEGEAGAEKKEVKKEEKK